MAKQRSVLPASEHRCQSAAPSLSPGLAKQRSGPHSAAAAGAAAGARTVSVGTPLVRVGECFHHCTYPTSASALSGDRTAGPSLAPAWIGAALGGGGGAECISTAGNMVRLESQQAPFADHPGSFAECRLTAGSILRFESQQAPFADQPGLGADGDIERHVDADETIMF